MTGDAAGRSPVERAQARIAWLFLAPALVLLLLIGIYPLLNTIFVSFTASQSGTIDNSLVGFRNYTALFGDSDFRASIFNTAIFSLFSVTLEFAIGLAMALAMNANFPGRALLRAAILVPWAIPTVVSARMWGWMLNDSFGVINDLALRKFHLIDHPIAWTGTNGWAMVSVILVDVWKTSPFFSLLLLAGLQVIPRDLYESARVDGASAIQQFFRITLPLLKPAIAVAVIFRALDAIRVFDAVWVLTEGRFSTESVGTFGYRQLFQYFNNGKGSAVCVILFLMVFIFVAVYTRLVKSGERA